MLDRFGIGVKRLLSHLPSNSGGPYRVGYYFVAREFTLWYIRLTREGTRPDWYPSRQPTFP
jgi:hypothetical protein